MRSVVGGTSIVRVALAVAALATATSAVAQQPAPQRPATSIAERAIATSVSALMMMRQLLREAWPDARFVGVVHLDPAPKLVVCIQW
jgi:hypothetical protein